MDEFERKIKDIPWHGPSNDLEDRIFRRKSMGTALKFFLMRRVALGWAAVLVLCAGMIGYGVGSFDDVLSSKPMSSERIHMHVIETGYGSNFFDLTRGGADILPGELIMKVGDNKEIEG